jgi:DNA-binding NarL/FixJ family response regulator
VIRVAVLDAHALIAEAIAHRLSSEGQISVRLATANPDELAAKVSANEIDVVVLDFALRTVRGGLDILRHALVQAGRVRIVMISGSNRREDAQASRAHGASGFVFKSGRMSEIVDAIYAVDGGASYFDSSMGDLAHRSPPSGREIEVLEALRSGNTNAEIGRLLGISTRTVESHLRRLFARYDVSSRAELLMMALRQNWVALDAP